MSLNFEYGPKKAAIPVKPNDTIAQALQAFCKKFTLPEDNWQVLNGKKEVDLSLTFRLSGLPSHAKLILSKKTAPNTPQEVNVALQFESNRLISKFPSTTTLWDILKYWEKEKNLNLTTLGRPGSGGQAYMQPVITYTAKEIATNGELRATSLTKLGLSDGSGLLRLHHKLTDLPLEQFLQVDQKSSVDEKMKEEKEKMEIEMKRQKMLKERADQEAIEKEKLLLFQQEEMQKAKIAEQKKKVEGNEDHIMEDVKGLEEIRKQIREEERKQQLMEQAKLEEERKERERLEKVEQERMLQEIEMREAIRKKIRLEEERKRVKELEKEKEELAKPKDRKPQVFAPSSTPFDPRSIELPDDFYEVTSQDLKLNATIVKQRKLEQEKNAQLKTKEMREKEKVQKLSKYKSCYIRVRFPDRVELQAIFNPLEKPTHIYQFIKESLSESNKEVPFHIYTVPPKSVIDQASEQNLRDLGFVPAILIYFDINEGYSISTPYLKDELIKDIREKLPPPQIIVPKKDQIIEAKPIIKEVKLETRKEDDYSMEITPEDIKKEEKKAPAWFMKGKK